MKELRDALHPHVESIRADIALLLEKMPRASALVVYTDGESSVNLEACGAVQRMSDAGMRKVAVFLLMTALKAIDNPDAEVIGRVDQNGKITKEPSE